MWEVSARSVGCGDGSGDEVDDVAESVSNKGAESVSSRGAELESAAVVGSSRLDSVAPCCKSIIE